MVVVAVVAVAADKVREDEEMVVEVATVLVKAMAVAGREVAMEVVVMARRWGRRGRWQAWRLGEGGGTVAAAEMVVEEGRACELAHIRCEFCVFTVWARCHAFFTPEIQFPPKSSGHSAPLVLRPFRIGFVLKT